MREAMMEMLSGVRTLEDMLAAFATRRIADDCWKAWYGGTARSARSAATSVQSRSPVETWARSEPRLACINVRAAIVGSSSR